MPSDSFNYEQAMMVEDGLIELDLCEDPDAVREILDDEKRYAHAKNRLNQRVNSGQKSDFEELHKYCGCCVLLFCIWMLYIAISPH